MFTLYYFILGLVFGSFANALVDRVPKGISWTSGRSKCDHCGHVLAPYDLIPLFSYLSLLGKCRYCHKKISARNFFVELAMGIGFAVLATNWFLLPIFWLTLVIAVMDWETQLVSEKLVLIWGGLTIAYKLFGHDLNLVSIAIGVAVGVAIIGGIWLVTKGRGMGFGDVEISVVMGLWLGWPNILVGLWLAFITGAIVGVIKVITKKSGLKSTIAFGPFLIIGSWIASVWGDIILARLFN